MTFGMVRVSGRVFRFRVSDAGVEFQDRQTGRYDWLPSAHHPVWPAFRKWEKEQEQRKEGATK